MLKEDKVKVDLKEVFDDTASTGNSSCERSVTESRTIESACVSDKSRAMALSEVKQEGRANETFETVENRNENRNKIIRVRFPFLLEPLALVVDAFTVSISGTIVSVATFLICCWAITSGHIGDPALMLDTVFWIGMVCFGLFLVCSSFPVWSGILVLLSQIVAGRLIGQIIVDILCYSLAVDPRALSPLLQFTMCSSITLIVGVLPIISLPLYRALMESSPYRSTFGPFGINSMVGDLNGNRLSFRRALNKTLVECFAPFLYAIARVQGRNIGNRHQWLEENTGTIRLKRPLKRQSELQREKDSVKVGYRIFQEFEHLFQRQNPAGPKIIQREDPHFTRGLWFVVLLSYLTTMCLFNGLLHVPWQYLQMGVLGTVSADPAPIVNLVAYLAGSHVQQIFSDLIVFAGGLFILYFTHSLCRPTHIELRKEGLRFNSSRLPVFMQDDLTPWSKIQSMYVEHPPKKASVADRWLVFGLRGGKRIRLRLGNITSIEGKEEILKAVERWAPDLPRTVEVITSLQPPCDFSYTELWLEALSAPPKRDRLKPLIEGAMLKDRQYTVKRMLGSGGQGTAYLVEDITDGQSVVLKEFVLPVYVDVAVRRQALEIFEKEARLLKQLSHPNIVKLIDYFIEDHRAYLVLEHIDGDSLRTLVETRGPIDEDRVRQLGKQMCDILEYLHEQSPPVVHRDFTPENLILGNDGTLKLIDFNVAHQESETTVVSSVVGKPAYLPPEQFRGTPTPQSDLYALGGCLYFLITGKDPVPITKCEVLEMRSDASIEIAELIANATEPDLENRIAAASAVRDILIRQPDSKDRNETSFEEHDS